MSSDLFVLIDIGGTAVKSAVADAEGRFLTRSECPARAREEGGPGLVRRVEALVKEALDTYRGRIAAAAISTAGMVDPRTFEIVYSLPDSIPAYQGVNHALNLKKSFGLPCSVENDVNCAALGEFWLGAGKGRPDLFCMTIGTSIGGAMICNSQLVRGTSFAAGEIAYMQVPGGILHSLASASALIKNYAKMSGVSLGELNGAIVFDRADQDDPLAAAAIAELAEHLCDGIANVVCVQNPGMVILGGGIMAREERLRPLIESGLQRRLRPPVYAATEIAFAHLKNNAGMLGALYRLKEYLQL